MFEGRLNIPIKYKFLGVILFILLSALSVFFYFTNDIFSEDKKLFVMDLNLTMLRAATAEIKLDIRSRLEELQIVIPRVYRLQTDSTAKDSTFDGLSKHLPEEMLRITFWKVDRATKKLSQIRDYKNTALMTAKRYPDSTFADIDAHHPITFDFDSTTPPTLELLNRSVRTLTDNNKLDVGVFSFMLPGSFVDSDSRDLVIVVDLLQDFLRKKLQQSELAQLFLITRKGLLLSHGVLGTTVEFSDKPFKHPIQSRLQTRSFPRESFELDIDGEPHLCNLTDTGFNDILAVSQVKESEAFGALQLLLQKTLLLAVLILCVAVVVSVLFVARLTANIKKLQLAAEEIGQGNLKTKLNIHSSDEISSVARSFEFMVSRLQELIKESAKRARMEDELETARLVQSTLLTTPEVETLDVKIDSHYVPATECGGDVWDANLDGNKLTLFLGDATGHGAPAAIVTAVAKSCFNTLNNIYAGQPLAPEQLATILNMIMHTACKGKLLMTMCIVQLDLDTGELAVCNAGHEAPICLRAGSGKTIKNVNKKSKNGAEVLFARGERLGFDPTSSYESVKFQLNMGDTLLLYTDGISEAQNIEGKEWGERALKKKFVEGGSRDVALIKTALIDGLNDHTQGAEQNDDITFVLLTLRKKVSGSNQGGGESGSEAA